MGKISVMGIPFDNVTMDGALTLAFSYMTEGKQALAVTPNAEILQLCLTDGETEKAILSADIILPDGEGALWAAKKLGTPLTQKVAGVDFGMNCAERAAELGYSLFLLGGKEGVAEKAACELQKRFPSLTIAGTQNGYFEKSGDENEFIINKINASGADILYVCLGAPSQEKWVYANREKIKTPHLIACLGGSLDVYAGTAKRAPRLFIQLKLEWFYRLIREPWRLGRMMNLPKFMISVCKYKRKTKKTR